MKIWIHQIKESMHWQKNNYEMKLADYVADPTSENLARYVASYGEYMKLEGKYEQWHTDNKEFKENGYI